MSIQKQLENILVENLKDIERTAVTNKTLTKVGEEAAKQVRKRTRLGKGIRTPGGKVNNLKALKKKTIEKRKFYSSNLSPYTLPPRSNLTATGQLLDSITYRIIRTKMAVQLYFKENRNRELGGGPSEITHKKLSKYVEKNGRPFFYLANFELNKLKSIILDAFNKS